MYMETPFSTVPGGAADGSEGVSDGVLGEADEEAEEDAKVREFDASRMRGHTARTLNVVGRIVYE